MIVSKPGSPKGRSVLFCLVALGAAALLCLSAAIAGAHGDEGALPNGGRLPGQPDFKRIGKTTYRFLAGKGEYEIHKKGRAPSFVHLDPAPKALAAAGGSSLAASVGGWVPLPSSQLAPVCRPSGNRIVPVYTYRPGDPTPPPDETIRAIVRRMNWKIAQQSSLSSGGARPVEMAVDCTGSTINVKHVATSDNFLTIFEAVKNALGAPTDAEAVKYLVFDSQAYLNYGGFGERKEDPSKDFINLNAIESAAALIYKNAWEFEVPVHELMHTLGASQGDGPEYAPFSTGGSHCTDGIDILCYYDESARSGSYSESRCPASSGYETPEGVPIDCGNDTYFDTLPGKGSWLDTYWNSGGDEDPYLVNLDDPLMRIDSGWREWTDSNNDTYVGGQITSWGYLPATYRFEYGETTSYGQSTAAGSPVLYDESYYGGMLPALDPGKEYHYRLSATRHGHTAYGQDVSFTTPETAVVGVKNTETTLKGGINPKGLSTTYQFEYGTTTSYGSKIPASPKSIGSGTSWVGVSQTPSGLTPGTTYHFRLAKTNAEGTTYSEDETFHTYKVMGAFSSSFGTPGSKEGQLSGPQGIATSSSGESIYVADTNNNRIEKFNPKGEYVSKFGDSGTGQLSQPHGIFNDPVNDVWVADTNDNRIVRFNSAGTYQSQLGSFGSGSGQLDHPRDVAVRSDSTFALDTGNNRVEKFLSSGSFWSQFGSSGSEAGQFSSPNGLAIDAVGNVWVADAANNRIEEFDFQGTFLAQFGSKGTGPGQFESPSGIAIDSQGAIWVADTGNHRIQELNARGEFLAQLGSKGTGPGQLESPTDVAVDSKGRVWATDSTTNKVSKWIPFTATSNAASNVGITEATLNGAVNPNGFATTYQFEYGPTTSYGTKVPTSPKSVGSGTSAVAVSELLTGLKSGTTYHFRVVASSGEDVSSGADETFTTPQDTPRWSVNGKNLAAGETKPFTATSTTETVLSAANFGFTFPSPAGECSLTGEIEGSALGTPGKEKNVLLSCKKVTLAGEPKCTVNSPGSPAGTVATNSLKSTLVWLGETGAAAGELLEPSSGTNLAEIVISGSGCAASGTYLLQKGLIDQFLPVEEEATTAELNLPASPLLNYWNNEATRAKQTITQLKLSGQKTTLSGKFAFSLNSKEPVGVRPG